MKAETWKAMKALADAARNVIGKWEGGSLADAVTRLSQAAEVAGLAMEEDCPKVRAEIGSSGRYKTVEITWDAAVDIAAALAAEHDETVEQCAYCDVCTAREAGYVFSAAHLLLGATETPLLDAVCALYPDEMDAGKGWPKDWDEWAEWFKAHTWECPSCGSFVHEDYTVCGNCLKGTKPETADEDEDEDTESKES